MSSPSRSRTGTTCYVTARRDVGAHVEVWSAVASAHVYDGNPDTRGLLTPQQAILAGEVMRVVEARAQGESERSAIIAALGALLERLGELRG